MSETVSASKHLIARHAGSALWFARYMERIENLARLLDVTKTFAGDAEGGGNWLSLLRINGDQSAFFAKHAAPEATSVAQFYLLDAENPASVQSAIRCARENARTLRALISTEMWLQINVFHGRIRELSAIDIAPEELSGVCGMLKEGVQAHTGITEGTLYRDQCWHFYMMGRHLERANWRGRAGLKREDIASLFRYVLSRRGKDRHRLGGRDGQGLVLQDREDFHHVLHSRELGQGREDR